MMLYTTLKNIRNNVPCSSGWEKLLKHLGKTRADDEQLSFKIILESNGIEDAIWCLRSAEGYDREIRLFAIACARRVEHLDTTGQAKKTNDVSERFTNGLATVKELDAASDAALATVKELDAAWAAAMAAKDTAWDAAWAAMDAACAATSDAAWTAWAVAMATMDAQKEDFIKMFCTEE